MKRHWNTHPQGAAPALARSLPLSRPAGILAALMSIFGGLVMGASYATCVAGSIRESSRQIPVAYQVDVVVVGGSTWAVAAAVAASEQGATVFLAAPRPYLGEDLCGTLRLALAEGQTLDDPLARTIFGEARSTTPMMVKRTLDKALVDAKVNFLFGCYATDVLRNRDGEPCGIIMANRAGRQAMVAKIIVDATDRAAVARLAGASCRPSTEEVCEFRRMVIVNDGSPSGRSIEHRLTLPAPNGGFAAFAEIEQLARDRTYQEGQARASESLFFVPPDPIVGQKTATEWQPAGSPDVGHFRPAGVNRIYVISGSIDAPRDVVARLLAPTGLMPLGRLVGRAAAEEARRLADPDGAHLPGDGTNVVGESEVKELLVGVRPTDRGRPTVPVNERSVSVLGQYDVVVIGGGTSGAPAAIGAARQGAKTLVVEYQEGLGGTGTVGLIGHPYHGKDIGFTREVPFPDKSRNVEQKMEWYRREIRRAGGDIWLGAIGCGALVEGNRLTGAVVATPQGRGVVRAKVVIDATGNADIAVAAGAGFVYGDDEGDIALQGSGLPVRPLDKSYVNTDYLLVDEADMVDVWSALVGARRGMKPSVFDAGSQIQNRERRRVVGDHVLRYLDQVMGRTYPDSIVLSESDYDSHGYPTQAFFALLPHNAKSLKANHPAVGGSCYTPYRCLLPKGLDGILVTGLGTSMERDASAMIRMQRDLQNQGYAAGVAAAMAAASGKGTRGIDIKAFQKHLVAVGNLPEEVLGHSDNYPFSSQEVAAAVRDLTAADRLKAAGALAVVLAHRETAIPMLQDAFNKAGGEEQLTFARILGFFGRKESVPVLLKALAETPSWDARVRQGVMAEYAHLPTPVDTLVLALGYTRDRRALPSILRKLESLDARSPLSHHRAVAVALEQIGDPSAAPPLAELLAKPGMSGHAMTELETLYQDMDRRRREGALREIVLARALYRCGDVDNVAENILEEYRRDLRGLLAAHACAVLDAGEKDWR